MSLSFILMIALRNRVSWHSMFNLCLYSYRGPHSKSDFIFTRGPRQAGRAARAARCLAPGQTHSGPDSIRVLICSRGPWQAGGRRARPGLGARCLARAASSGEDQGKGVRFLSRSISTSAASILKLMKAASVRATGTLDRRARSDGGTGDFGHAHRTCPQFRHGLSPPGQNWGGVAVGSQ